MPVLGQRQTEYVSASNSYRKDKVYPMAKAFAETANMILKEDGVDIFDEPQKVLRRADSREAMRKFFTENSFDSKNVLFDAQDIEDQQAMMEAQFENDAQAVYEHAAPADYSPIVGMALPIHKLILMNNVFDKGGIQKVTAQQPKFTISLERRILVKPDGTEIDMFLEQNKMTDAINSTNPTKNIELALPVTEDLDVIGTYFNGTALDNLDISTYISAVLVKNMQFDPGMILPDADGYIRKNGQVATETTVMDAWIPVDIRFTPNYGGPNHFDRAVTAPRTIVYKDGSQGGAETVLKFVISGGMNKNRFVIADLNNKITKIMLTAKIDSSSAMLETCRTYWKVDTDIVEIGSAVPINTTISPDEVKDISALYNVNQLTKHMSMFKTVMSNYKDDMIRKNLDDSFDRLDERTGFQDEFDFAPPAEYALTAVEYRSKMFMDFLDTFTTYMLWVLNDPNMTFTIYGDPQVVRKVTPKEYSYSAPATIGPVELDYTQTIVNLSDKRVYNFIGSDKLRNTNELIILINPHNSERIIYRIYDYQLYVSNEIRNIANPALPAIHAFERWKFVEYQPVQGRVQIKNIYGYAHD